MLNQKRTLIKEVNTDKYSVSLMQDWNDEYYILYAPVVNGVLKNQKVSEFIKDFGIASHLFDLKIKDFETH